MSPKANERHPGFEVEAVLAEGAGAGPIAIRIEDLLDRTEDLRALARHLVRDASLADDVLQATYVAALENPPRPPYVLDAWLRRVLRNVAAVVRRGEDRRYQREQEAARRRAAASMRARAAGSPRPGGEPSADSAFDDVTRIEAHRRLLEAVRGLDAPYRHVVMLRYFEGLSAAAIAKREGLPASTVRTRLQRALEALRMSFEADGADAADKRTRSAWIPAMVALGWGESAARAWDAAASGSAMASGAEAVAGSAGSTVSAGCGMPTWLGVGLVGGAVVLVAGLAIRVMESEFRGPESSAAVAPDDSVSAASSRTDDGGAIEEAEVAVDRTPSRLPAAGVETPRTDSEAAPPVSAPPQAAESGPTLRIQARFPDGTPAPGCRVQVDRLIERANGPTSDVTLRMASTDADGVLEIDRLEEAQYRVSVGQVGLPIWSANGGDRDDGRERGDGDSDPRVEPMYLHAIEPPAIHIEDRDRTHEITLPVARFSRVRGRVVDPARGPLAGATFTFFHHHPNGRLAFGGYEAEEDGSFDLAWRDLPGTTTELVVRHRNYADEVRVTLQSPPGGRLDVGSIELREATRGSVAGILEAADGAEHRLVVREVVAPGRELAGEIVRSSLVGSSEDVAEFRIDGLSPGSFRVEVEGRPDVEPVPFSIAEAGEWVDVGVLVVPHLPESRDYRLYGVVVDGEGRPMEGVHLRIDGTELRTDESGEVLLTVRSRGPHRITARYGRGGASWWRSFGSFEFDGSNVRLEMTPVGLGFRFVDAHTGEIVPWTHVAVHAFPEDPPPGGSTRRSDQRIALEPEPEPLRLTDHRESGRYRFLIQVDDWEIAELVEDIPEDFREREFLITVPLRRP